MESFLKAASLAWNPIGEVRQRIRGGTLTVESVLVPFIGIVIACNLFTQGAQMFFWESVLHQLGTTMPDHPLLRSDFAQRFMSAIGIIVPVGAVWLLPADIFNPSGRSATAAAMLVLAAAWAFYGAAIGVPVYFVAGALASVDAELGLTTYVLLSLAMSIGLFGLLLFFWIRITLSILRLSGAQTVGISSVAMIGVALLVGFFSFIASTS